MPETESAGSFKRVEASDNSLSPAIQVASVRSTEENKNEISAVRASFAYELRSVRRQNDASRVIFGWAALLNNLRNAEEVAWSRNGLDIRQRLRVRLSGSEGRAAVWIIGQTEGGDEQGVRDAAVSLAAVLGDSLRGIAYAYRFEPCMDREPQPEWGAVQDATHAMAVIRRESTITVADKPVYLRHDVFRASSGSDLLGMLAGCGADTAIDVSIAPTRITPEERAAASESMNVWTDGLSKMLDSDPVDRMMQSQRLADEAGGARSRLANFLEQSHDGLFEVRVQVLSAGPADLLPLANRVGIALFGPMKHECLCRFTCRRRERDRVVAPRARAPRTKAPHCATARFYGWRTIMSPARGPDATA